MLDHKRFWCLVVPIVLIAAVMAMTLGVVWHSHVNCSPGTCPLCHLVIAHSHDGIRAYALIPLGERPETQSTYFVAGSAPRQIPARAPPA